MNSRRLVSLLLVFVMLMLTLASCDINGLLESILGKTPDQSTTTTTQKPDVMMLCRPYCDTIQPPYTVLLLSHHW